MIKKGDSVRFLNAIGGGIVVRIDENKKLVYVEDEDGFEIPVLERECVKVGVVNKDTNFPVRDFKNTKPQVEIIPVMFENQIEKKQEPIVETPEGDTLKAVLAFFPIDIKQLQTTAYECYLVNDSNYFFNYNIVNGENDSWKSVVNGTIEPNTQELLCEVSKEELSAWEQLRVQIVAFKKAKEYMPQNVIDKKLKLNAVKFYKLHSFTENDYFDELAMIIDLTIDTPNLLNEVTAEDIKKAMLQKDQPARPRIVKHLKTDEVIEIDLHINELIDNITGLSNADMLQLQMDKFHAVIDENKNNKGQKLVFIHGKGEGVLRKEIEKQLRSRYKNYYFQDASFREYGFGATMVTIK